MPFIRTSLSQGEIDLRILQGLQSEMCSVVLFQTLFTDVYKIYHSNNCEFSYPKSLKVGSCKCNNTLTVAFIVPASVEQIANSLGNGLK